MNPIKSIKSRYSLCNVSSNFYGNINISGSTLVGTKGSGSTAGYIWLPYIIAQSNTIIIDREWQRQILRNDRKEKLKKLNW